MRVTLFVIFGALVLGAVRAQASDVDVAAAAGSSGGCDASAIVGFYGFVASGSVPAKSADGTTHLSSIRELGEVLYRADSSVVMTISVIRSGGVPTTKLSGTYSVDATTCVGIVQWSDGPTWRFVAVGHGAELDTVDARGKGTAESPIGALVFVQRKI
jgi:hypothetical protein